MTAYRYSPTACADTVRRLMNLADTERGVRHQRPTHNDLTIMTQHASQVISMLLDPRAQALLDVMRREASHTYGAGQ